MRCALVAVACLASVAVGGPWRACEDPAAAGWDPAGLDEARELAARIGSAAVMVVDRGVVVAAWGEIDRPLRTHSMRKSLYAATIGAAMTDRGVELDATLGEMGFDAELGLSEAEAGATFEDLLAARSGVYLPAAYETEGNAALRPERGSAGPGERWYYNNWDFNLIPAVFERQTGVPLADAFGQRLAGPLGFEDFDAERDVFEWLEPSVSPTPAVLLRVSARDLARVGVLHLNDGEWEGQRVLASGWAERSTSAVTTFGAGHGRGEGNGYGLLWWVYPADPNAPDAWGRVRRVAARGLGGHAMFLVPGLDLVIVHRTDTDSGPGVGDRDVAGLMGAILAARTGDGEADAATGPVRAERLNEIPAPDSRAPRPVPGAVRRALAGRYEGPGGMAFVVHEWGGRLFIRRETGGGASEAELFSSGDGQPLYSPVAPLEVRTLDETGGLAGAIEVTYRGRAMRADRRD